MKEAFAVLRKLITGSGFEDIIYQSGICSVGSLNGVLAGSHYNRCWIVYGHLSEALERLLLQRFLASVVPFQMLCQKIFSFIQQMKKY